jgi:ATP-dependent 26S proteasome regulatory subunit
MKQGSGSIVVVHTWEAWNQFRLDTSIFVIATTNCLQGLDSALIRSGRFDRIITIDLPNAESQEAIIHLYASHILSESTINYALLAQKTSGFNCPDLSILVN